MYVLTSVYARMVCNTWGHRNVMRAGISTLHAIKRNAIHVNGDWTQTHFGVVGICFANTILGLNYFNLMTEYFVIFSVCEHYSYAEYFDYAVNTRECGFIYS